jgi:hypothetical protein
MANIFHNDFRDFLSALNKAEVRYILVGGYSVVLHGYSRTAAQYFSDGIKAHMDQMATYDANCAVAAVARDTYITANPLGAGTELQQINTQYWIASFLNEPEAFANFRRSGFPTLTSNPYGQPPNADVPNGTFRRRLSYPASELSINTTNVNAAIAALGADKLSTKIWSDKP